RAGRRPRCPSPVVRGSGARRAGGAWFLLPRLYAAAREVRFIRVAGKVFCDIRPTRSVSVHRASHVARWMVWLWPRQSIVEVVQVATDQTNTAVASEATVPETRAAKVPGATSRVDHV